jgi:HSP20 family protein
MLTRFDPFRDIDRVFDRSWGPTRQPTVPVDVYRHGEEYVINVDLPGFDPETIDVTAEKDVLTIKAERQWQPAEGDEVVAAERTHGSFFRQLFLGDGLDSEHITASYENGVLMIKIPLSARAMPRRIDVAHNHAERTAIDA